MATETLILRPTYVVNRVNCTYFPSEFDVEKIHSLVSEEVADNDATYIIAKDGLGGPNFSFSVPAEFQDKTPSVIKICGVARGYETTDTETLLATYYYADSAAENGYGTGEIEGVSIANTDWAYFETTYPSEHIEAIYDWMVNNPSSTHTILSCSSIAKDTAEGVAITQLYLEVTYGEDEDVTSYSVYLKNSGVWEVIRSVIYKKIDGSWQEVTPASLQEAEYKVVDQRQFDSQ